MPGFTTLLTPTEAKARYARAYVPRPRGTERVPLADAFGRVLARDAQAPEDLPEFDRSTVDGYAVRADGRGRGVRGGAGDAGAGR